MIREKVILFKLNKLNLSDKELLSSTSYSHKICPGCKAEGCLAPHGTYSRDMIYINNNNRTDDTINIHRVLCSSCGTTHAILPNTLIPFSSYSLRFVLHVLKAYLVRTGTVAALCNDFSIAITTLYNWIHIFNEQANLIFDAVSQISWITANAIGYIEKINTLPSYFFEKCQFSFLQNNKQHIAKPPSG